MKKLSLVLGIIAVVVFMGAMCSTETTNTNANENANMAVITNDNADMDGNMNVEEDTTVVVAEGEYTDITPAEAKELVDNTSNLIIIDVSPDYANGHLPGAVNYYLGDGSLDEAIPTLGPNTPYLVYCHIESASRAGAQALVDAGFTEVYRLEGDYEAWVDAGYSVEK